ncbi:hypothetical protein AGMMS49543_23940 [Betaproteobacteria bacterium]|nr:hypothetical protein AGMMS49543_23940 [Betaproteobacteria bacterium]GHU23535.1 hypothetical protein AGMMS50243_25120 [Betaproteobacteria bacterium]
MNNKRARLRTLAAAVAVADAERFNVSCDVSGERHKAREADVRHDQIIITTKR